MHEQQNACMPSITVRNVSPETHDKLVSRAALKGKSLQEYLRAKLDEVAEQLDPEEWVEMVRRRQATMKGGVSVEDILKYKDMDKR
jgi:plasmid stability protein